MSNSLERQIWIEPILCSAHTASCDHDMVDLFIYPKGRVEEVQHGLVIGHVYKLEDTSRRLGRHIGSSDGRPSVPALLCQALAAAVDVANADIGIILAASLSQTGTDAIRTA